MVQRLWLQTNATNRHTQLVNHMWRQSAQDGEVGSASRRANVGASYMLDATKMRPDKEGKPELAESEVT